MLAESPSVMADARRSEHEGSLIGLRCHESRKRRAGQQQPLS